MFPDEEYIRVIASNKDVTLSGTVSNASILSQVLSLAQSYASEGTFKINNFLQVGGVQQVMLEVRIAEMSRNTVRRFGINFNYVTESGKFAIQSLNNLGRVSPVISPFDQTAGVTNAGRSLAASSRNVNLIFNFLRHNTSWTFFIDAIKDVGLIKILAEPTLITLSGKTAYFLAGGEFPVPIPQTGGGGNQSTITIQYKPFGIGLNFTPTVLSNGRINMEISPEVSELDFSNAVSFQGFVIPAITTRRVSTVIELADGQSFAIAGLLSDKFTETVRKYPFIGDLPIIGSLFRTSTFEKIEKELVIVVSPHLVKPFDKAKQTFPTDQYIEPNDIEFYLLGRLEGIKLPSVIASNSLDQKNKGGLEGKFGHLAP
jgi:pilus assembly protein CpaC